MLAHLKGVSDYGLPIVPVGEALWELSAVSLKQQRQQQQQQQQRAGISRRPGDNGSQRPGR